jgi:Zn-dependent M16 (insulinase) family peptidase
VVTLLPEPGRNEKQALALQEKLAAKKAAMTDAELDALIAQTKAFRAYQERPVTQEETACVPCLAREDLRKEPRPLDTVEDRIAGIPALWHTVNTDGISYVRLMFDMDALPKEDLPYVGFLEAVLGKLDTDHRPFPELASAVRLRTGALHYTATCHRKWNTADEFRPMYEVTFRALTDQVPEVLDLLREILTESHFHDVSRLRELLGETVSGFSSELDWAGDEIASSRALSYFSRPAALEQGMYGITAYRALKEIMGQYDRRGEEFATRLGLVARHLFRTDKLTVDYAAGEKELNALRGHLEKFLRGLTLCTPVALGATAWPDPIWKNEGFCTAQQVQYLARCGNLLRAGYSYTGALQVAMTAIQTDHLYKRIRVQGGAYGCFCRIHPGTGDVSFTSYRDPHLRETQDVYLETGSFLRTLAVDETELTKYVIGTFAPMEQPQSAYATASRSLRAYLSGRTVEQMQAEREAIRSVTLKQVRDCADALDAVLQQGYTCALGAEQMLREQADLFDRLELLS